jgi:cytosine deaminase
LALRSNLPFGIPKVVAGEDRNFVGDDALLRSQGVEVEVLQDPACIELLRQFIAARPDLWTDDIGQP